MDSRNSNSDVTMAANNAFANILSCIQSSGLNHKIQMTPFSANISLKKSLIKTLSGSPFVPTVARAETDRNVHERELIEMRNSYEDLLQKLAVAYQKIEELENDINDRNKTNRNHTASKNTSFNLATITKKEHFDEVVETEGLRELCEIKSEFNENDLGGMFCDYDFQTEDESKNAEENTLAYESDGYLPSDIQHFSHEQYNGVKSIPASNYSPEECLERDLHSLSSQVAHWIPSLPPAPLSTSSSASFKAHYVMSNSLKEKLCENEILRGLQAILEKQEQMDKNCKQS